MTVRIKLKLTSKSTGREVEAVALVNTGFETLKPQLLVPVKVAELLGLWPSTPREYSAREYMTAGGPIRNYVLADEVEVKVMVEHETGIVLSDLVISTIEEEILISDKLSGRIGIEIYDLAEGIWRLKSDPPNVRRKSEERQAWL
jgi:hypothetical protein